MVRITKRYGRKLTLDYNSWEFMTELSKDVDVKNKEELIAECDKLFNAARVLTVSDIEKVKSEIKPIKTEISKNNSNV